MAFTSGLLTGLIIGGVIGGLIGVAIMCVVIVAKGDDEIEGRL